MQISLFKALGLGLIAVTAGCSTSGGESGITARSQTAVTVERPFMFSDFGRESAQAHCGQYGKVATLDSSTPNAMGTMVSYTYLCV